MGTIKEGGRGAEGIRHLMARLTGLLEASRGCFRELSSMVHDELPPKSQAIHSLVQGDGRGGDRRQTELFIEGWDPPPAVPQKATTSSCEGVESPGSFGSPKRTPTASGPSESSRRRYTNSTCSALPEPPPETPVSSKSRSFSMRKRASPTQELHSQTSNRAGTDSEESSGKSGSKWRKRTQTASTPRSTSKRKASS